MISAKRLEELRQAFTKHDNHEWRAGEAINAFPDLCDTLSAALRVVEAAKLKLQRHAYCVEAHPCVTVELIEALAPFAEEKEKKCK